MTITLNGDTGITSPNDTTGNQSYTGTLTGGTGIVNLGSGQFYKDASGNVGIGMTPASTVILDVKEPDAGQDGIFRVFPGTGNGIQIRSIAQADSTTSAMSFYTVAGSSATERMRIDSAGNVGIGTSSPTEKLDVLGTIRTRGTTTPNVAFNDGTIQNTIGISGSAFLLSVPSANPIVFNTTNTERMRIDSSGNLLVNTVNTAANAGDGLKFLGGTSNRLQIVNSGAAEGIMYYNSSAGAYRFYVNAAGTIFATSTTISAISDQRLKENVRDLNTGLDAIMAVKPRRFDWKEGKGLDKKDDVGFIAQEFETVFPDSVTTSLAGKDGIEYKTINHGELIPTLVKAIQEQQALIESLTTRLTVLEAK